MMRRRAIANGALAGLLISLPVLAIMAVGQQLMGLPFVPFDLFDWMARVLPGGLIRTTIAFMVSLIGGLQLGPTDTTAKLLEQSIAIVQFIVGGMLFGVILNAIGSRQPDRLRRDGATGGALIAAAILLIEASLGVGPAGIWLGILWVIVIFVGSGYAIGWWLQRDRRVTAQIEGQALTRRQFLLRTSAASIAITLSGLGLTWLLSPHEMTVTSASTPTTGPAPQQGPITPGVAAAPPPAILAARIAPAPGTRSEITSNADFYRIDIDALPPRITADTWHLQIDGLVDKPLKLSLDDLRARPAVSQVMTLECISNPVGGDLTSTAQIVGIPFKTILAEAGLQPAARSAYITSTDGYYETVVMPDIQDERTLLVYEMNGEPLPVEHGFPLRIYIPNRFGMKQPKWIEHIELVDQERPGYWVVRGWDNAAIPPTTSVIDPIDTAAAKNSNTLPIGGIAYAGARGLSRVEVNVDGGAWTNAQLRVPPLSMLTWVQWRYDWPIQPGQHTFQVRAYDGTGQLQITTPSDPFPSGATGIYARTVEI
jgi:DMSO/TMAO reductase YedYZ molybdopterin-dependent catalytic subunit